MTSPTEAGPPEGIQGRRALVVGTGLIGGSVALALRRRGWHVAGIDHDPERLDEALAAGVIDLAGDDPEAEIVFVAVPASAVAATVRDLLADGRRRPDAVVTDVCGVKTAIVAQADHARFVGGHPMAGSEQVGLRGADPDLFEGAVWVLTPTATTDLASFERLRAVVSSLGADVLVLAAADHDRLVAVVSHVPHLVAATLMNEASTGAEQDAALLRLAAGGFRDMTRVAAGHPGIWPDICAENAPAIVDALDGLVEDLRLVRDRVAARRPWCAPPRPAASERGPAQPAGAGRPARQPGRAPNPGARPGGRAGRDHLAGRRRRHRDLRHRDRALGRGPAWRAHPRRRRGRGRRPGHRRRGARVPLPGRAAVMTPPRGLVVTGGVPCRGTVRTPGEKSISHRAVLLGALAEGTSVVHGLSDGADVAASLAAVEALGAGVEHRPGGAVAVHGGRDRLHAAAGPLDCGNSGTSMRLLAGLVAGFGWVTELAGDASLSVRPMDRVAEPLALMGARVEGRGEHCFPPLRVHGGSLRGIDWTSKVASAQVKSAILLAGLSAEGTTTVREAVTTRTHTEEMLAEAGADIEVEPWGEGRVVRVRASSLTPVERTVPGDPSQAAFFVVAGCVVPGSEVAVRGVYDGPARLGFVDVLRRMGAAVALEPEGSGTTTIRAAAGPLRATTVAAREIPSLDEVPALAVAAAVAEGTTVFTDVGELRVKEVDRLAAVAAMVEAFGATARIEGDTLAVTGAAGMLRGARVDSLGDHRMAMAAAVAGLAAGPGARTVVTGFGATETSYPAFASDLAALTSGGDAPQALLVAIDGPAGAGKSTVSSEVAERLGLERLDTGAMYRAVAALALARGTAPDDRAAVAALARAARIEVGERVSIDGLDVSGVIRSPEVGRAVSVVAANPDVRRHLVARQRAWADEHGGGVVEGRDIGSVVFPDATLKVYLTASPVERARRRHDETPEGVARRDRIDSTRQASPLHEAPGARLLDTTGRTVHDVVEEVLSWL